MTMDSFQQESYEHLTKDQKSLMIQYGRQSGKSLINQYLQQWQDMQEQQQPLVKIIDQATVDGAIWYTVTCRKEVSMWIRENGVENESWFEHIDGSWHIHKNMFDVSEEFYMMVVLKFGK